MTASEKMAKEIAALLRSRQPIIWIVTPEEERAEMLLIEACAAASYIPETWDVAAGICDMNGQNARSALADPGEIGRRAPAQGKNDVLITHKPHNPQTFDLARDYTDFVNRPVTTEYLTPFL